MFRDVLCIAAASIGMIVAPANLTASKVGGAVTSKNNVGDKTDFHLELGGSTKIDVTSATANGVAGTITGDNTTSPKIEWMLTTKRGDTVNWKWAGTQPGDKNISKQKPVFTPVGSPTDIAALGWNVEPRDVFLLNDFTSDIFFDNLLFRFPANFSADSLLDLALGPPVGVLGLLGSGIVPAGGQVKAGEFVLPLGSFLTLLTMQASLTLLSRKALLAAQSGTKPPFLNRPPSPSSASPGSG
jgi:hypothetical protein